MGLGDWNRTWREIGEYTRWAFQTWAEFLWAGRSNCLSLSLLKKWDWRWRPPIALPDGYISNAWARCRKRSWEYMVDYQFISSQTFFFWTKSPHKPGGLFLKKKKRSHRRVLQEVKLRLFCQIFSTWRWYGRARLLESKPDTERRHERTPSGSGRLQRSAAQETVAWSAACTGIESWQTNPLQRSPARKPHRHRFTGSSYVKKANLPFTIPTLKKALRSPSSNSVAFHLSPAFPAPHSSSSDLFFFPPSTSRCSQAPSFSGLSPASHFVMLRTWEVQRDGRQQQYG